MDARGASRLFGRIDLLILLPALLLLAAGLLSVYSATHNAELITRFHKQVFWAVLGALLMTLVLLAPQRFFHYSAYLLYAGANALLLLVLIFGRTIGGNAGWFGVAGFGIQPSEIAKLATILALARFLSDSTTSLGTFRDLGKALAITGVPWLLILLQPDFGTGLVYWAFFLPMIYWAGADLVLLLTLVSPVLIAVVAVFNLWWFLAAVLAVSALFYLLKRDLGVALLFLGLNLSVGYGVQYAYEHLPVYQRDRVAVFLDPTRAPLAAGYNVIQSKVAIGSGGLTGRGYLQGSQTQLRFVPEQWTDFIFCVPAEEFGFTGAVVILGLFAVFLLRGLALARALEFRFSSLVVLGITAMFMFHTFVNVAMAQGLIPVVGIPLPFMSYGGSFTLTALVAVGVMLHAAAGAETSP